MIQRIQSLYLVLAIICLAIVTTGTAIFSHEGKDFLMVFSVFGIEKFDAAHKSIELISYPYFMSTSILILLSILCLLSYKNLKNQIKLIKIINTIYLMLILLLFLFLFFAKFSDNSQFPSLKLGFYLLILGFPFIFLAYLGIKKDKNLLDSLNRLR